MENSILVVIGILVLGFAWLIWARQHVLMLFWEARRARQTMQADLDKRRDTVPFLLESFRHEESLANDWRILKEERARFHTQQSLELEFAFEAMLLNFLKRTSLKNLQFLEAKKDIEDLTDLIERQKAQYESAKVQFEALKKQFPYSVASAMFGLRGLTL